jgi:hypothetical protein
MNITDKEIYNKENEPEYGFIDSGRGISNAPFSQRA